MNRYIGTRDFYKMVMTVAVPIMIQNFITSFVGMLDNIMVGQVGTAQMSGVSIVNQIIFVLNLCLFGANAGAGIFTAQFAGSRNEEGVRYTFRFKLIISLVLTAFGIVVLRLFGAELISLFLKGESGGENAELYLGFGRRYLSVMLWGLVPFALTNVYSGTLRESGETMVPMMAGISAVLVNLALNYILIFGKLGAPALGVEGAAIATVISRFVELGIAALWTHRHPDRMPFIVGAYRSLSIPKDLVGKIVVKGMPLLLNEALWSSGIAILSQCYSLRGLLVVAAVNISTTITNMMSVSLLAMGNAVGIIVGQKLGARCSEEEVLDTVRKLAAFTVAFTALFALLQLTLSGMFPLFYNTTGEVREMAAKIIRVSALVMPARAFTNASYFTLRSGGQTVVTFLFDSCFVWAVCVPLAYCLSRFTALTIVPLYAIVEGTELLKCAVGYFMLRSKKWIQTIIA